MVLVWSAAARADLARIFDFNLTRSDTWAMKVDTILLEQVEVIARRPLLGRPRGRETLRSWSVPDLQYVLTYRFDGTLVTIVEVRHTRENRGAS